VKYCIDCRHFRLNTTVNDSRDQIRLAQCAKGDSESTDQFLSPAFQPELRYCGAMRIHPCGPDAALFDRVETSKAVA
jgi:hypothetical protein